MSSVAGPSAAARGDLFPLALSRGGPPRRQARRGGGLRPSRRILPARRESDAELVDVLDRDFEGREGLLSKLRYEGPKMGNGDSNVDALAHGRVINGGPLTMEFHSALFDNEESQHKVAELGKLFIARVWGWSAYFIELDREYQDHVIRRQEYVG